MENISNRAAIRYLGLKGLTPNEVHEDMVATLGEDAPSYTIVKKWAAEFKRGRESLEDDPRPGRRVTVTTPETIAKIHDIIMADRRVTERYIAIELGISQERVHTVIHNELQMSKVSKGVLFHQDNAPAHKSTVAMAAIHECGFELVDHPPYSPDLAPLTTTFTRR